MNFTKVCVCMVFHNRAENEESILLLSTKAKVIAYSVHVLLNKDSDLA